MVPSEGLADAVAADSSGSGQVCGPLIRSSPINTDPETSPNTAPSSLHPAPSPSNPASYTSNSANQSPAHTSNTCDTPSPCAYRKHSPLRDPNSPPSSDPH